jgi:AcrR family transcriptional regulator
MYDQVDEEGHNRFTVAQIAAEFGVTRPTIYRYLDDKSLPGAESAPQKGLPAVRPGGLDCELA